MGTLNHQADLIGQRRTIQNLKVEKNISCQQNVAKLTIDASILIHLINPIKYNIFLSGGLEKSPHSPCQIHTFPTKTLKSKQQKEDHSTFILLLFQFGFLEFFFTTIHLEKSSTFLSYLYKFLVIR